MTDRVAQYANRYKLTPVSGTSDTYDLEAAPGVVTEAGTDLNKATLLKDTTAALYGLGPEAVPDDVFEILSTRGHVISGSYVGTGATTKTIFCDGMPCFVVIGTYAGSYDFGYGLGGAFYGFNSNYRANLSLSLGQVTVSGFTGINLNALDTTYNYVILSK